MIRVLVADDQLLFRSMLEEMLRKDVEIEIVASAANGSETVKLALQHKPDVVLLDIEMPEKNGVEALKEIKAALPSTKVAILTTFEDLDNIRTSCHLGADGYLVKDMKPNILLMAIKCLYHDIVLFHRSAYSAIISSKGLLPLTSTDRIEFGDMVFDHIDISIMKQIASGKTNKDIAQMLSYSEGTIKNRVSRILSVTGLSDRTGISIFAIKNQLI